MNEFLNRKCFDVKSSTLEAGGRVLRDECHTRRRGREPARLPRLRAHPPRIDKIHVYTRCISMFAVYV